MERVNFTTYDSVELTANLYLPEGATSWSPGMVVCHGFGSNKERYADFGERGTAAGYAVLIPDLRGHGESGGELDANIFNDVAASVSYLQTRPEVNPVSVAIRGASMGGWLAIHTASHLVDVAPVVAYCPTNDAAMLILMEEVGLVQRGHKSPYMTENPPRVNVNSMVQLLYRTNVHKAARRITPRPLLIIHCEEDEVVPSNVSQRIYDAAAEPKALWLLPGGDHRFAQHDPATDARMLEWVREVRMRSGDLTSADISTEVPEDF